MLILQDVTYIHPNKDVLFAELNLSINKHSKVALIGNNGTGKSTLLKLVAGKLHPSAGQIKMNAAVYYVPQLLDAYDASTIAQALGIDDRLQALRKVLQGDVSEENITRLNNDWAIEERCAAAFAHWQLYNVDLHQQMNTLSGGQKLKVFLAGIRIHEPDVVLLDEPSNHLDADTRAILYQYITATNHTLLVVSHDRVLLDLLNTVFELSHTGITSYGGNYDFYEEQKLIENKALHQDLKNKEKTLRKAKEIERETLERQNKLDARGKKKQEKAGLPTISMKTFKNNAEKSTSRIKDMHQEKISTISRDLNQLRLVLPSKDEMKINFDDSALHSGKILITAVDINYVYSKTLLWKQALNIQVRSGERIVIKGQNGSGKTTLLKILLGELEPRYGRIERTSLHAMYIDQHYSIINNAYTVYEHAQLFNSGDLQEHEVKICLNRFLFPSACWDKSCKNLSGGEKMRLILCMLTISNQSPDIIVLDEPTNNLDIQNTKILTTAINEYKGTLLVISHDEYFLKQVGVERVIQIAYES